MSGDEIARLRLSQLRERWLNARFHSQQLAVYVSDLQNGQSQLERVNQELYLQAPLALKISFFVCSV